MKIINVDVPGKPLVTAIYGETLMVRNINAYPNRKGHKVRIRDKLVPYRFQEYFHTYD